MQYRATTAALLLAIMSGCSTPYQKTGFRGGFEDTRLADNIFTVQFSGNGFTNPKKASDFLMLRAAELSLENGFPYFEVSGATNSSVTNYSGSYGGGSIGVGAWYFPRGEAKIVCYKTKPAGNQYILDAALIRQEVRAKYKIKDKAN